MRTSRKGRLGPDTAERLLTTGRDPAFPELSRLYAAASAPPQRHELVGLDAAVAAFREAGRVGRPAATPRRRVLRPLAVAAAVTAMFAGGVAVAAETGKLPGGGGTPAGGEATTTAGAPASGTGATPGPSGTPSVLPAPTGPGRTLSPTSPDAIGLCRAWDTRRRDPDGPPMKAEAVRDLVAAAGGEDRIPAFCAPALAVPSGPAATRPGTVPPTPSHPAGNAPPRPTPSTGRKGTANR
jgi:hypothetical protein